MMSTRLTTEQIERYSRQIMVPDIGGKGQIHLRQSRVLVIGAGGLGSPAAFYLAAAGIGTLGIIDPDKVELSNLQRQILHTTADIGRQKVESAQTKLNDLNPDVEIKTYIARFGEDNAAEIAGGYDFIVDGSDNFDTKFLVNDVAIRLDIAFSHAGIVRLIELGRKLRCAIMCSEAVWWRRHRRIVADHLLACGETVFHIMGQGRLEPAHFTIGAVIQSGGTVIYPGV